VQRSRLGTSDVTVSRVVLGCMAFAPRTAADTARIVHAAFDHGITSFDTAPLYGYGESEEALGRALADRRQRVEILTKVGLRWDDVHGDVLFETVDAGVRRVVRKDARPDSIRAEIARSLRRLGTDTIDLLQLHHPDPHTPLDDTLEALRALQRAGVVRAIGVSNVTAAQLRQAAAGRHPPVVAAQQEYSLLARQIESDLLPAARASGTALLAHSPLARGVLAGRQLGGRPPPADWRSSTGTFDARVVARVNGTLEAVVLPIARAHGVTPGQLALAWVLAQPGVAAVIAGASTGATATENAAAADVSLPAPAAARLAQAFAGIDTSPRTGPLARARRLLGRLRGR
jgi:aryl-alcohol dehydrogenase-like predicted oxidoreductase